MSDPWVSIASTFPWTAFPAYLYGSGRFGVLAQAQLSPGGGFVARIEDFGERLGADLLAQRAGMVAAVEDVDGVALPVERIERGQREIYPALARRAKSDGADIFFWDESGFRADAVHGKTWGRRGKTPVVHRPGQRQSMSAASAIQARGAFWFCTYQGALNAELFIELLKKMTRHRKRPLHLVLDGLPAHKKALVKDYVQSTDGRLTLHFLPGYAPDLNPDELVWSHVKRTGTARRPLQQGEKLQERIAEELLAVQRNRPLVRSFFRAPSVSYISDC